MDALSWLPGWIVAAALVLIAVLLVRHVRRTRATPPAAPVEELEHDE